jgi:hypothetical protein
MTRYRSRTIGAALAVGAVVALPGVASASPATALTRVQAHTHKADAALTRASALFASGKDAKAVTALARSRAESGRSVAEAAALVRAADTPAERVAAARALRSVATAQANRIPPLVRLLGPADAAHENPITAAARADTIGRDHAIAVLRALLAKGMPKGAQVGIGRAIAALSIHRTDEVRAEATAVARAKITPKTAARLATLVDVNLRGQARAAAILTVLKGRLPAAAGPGLDRALAAVAAEQGTASTTLDAAAGGMPAPVRELVGQVAARAADSAAAIRSQLAQPATPVPGPPSTPVGPPAGTPGAARGH